jgi:lipopolysaccharide/colanic/teichoic acid biosynthesis glycosyltransferase
MSYERSDTEPGRSERRPAEAGQAGTRCLDLLGAGVGLLLLWPLLLALAVAIRLTSPGPALFRSTRVGRNARPFTLYKFRSMIPGAQTVGPAITAADDSRVTAVGATLRRLKLDELPQLLNVLKGDMSLVGPRPEDPSYVAKYSREQLAILEAKPGITSPASLCYRDEETQLVGEDWEDFYIREVMPAKLAIDCEYLRERTLWSDLTIILNTAAGLLGRQDRP